jgi:hypothetical protein
LIVLSLIVGGAGVLALARSVFVTEAGRGREQDEMARRIQRRNEACLKRVEELERVYREEILPARKGLTQNRQELEELFGTFTPELGAVAASRDLGRWPPASDNEGGLAWDRVQEVLPEALRDPRTWSQAGFAGKDGGREAFLKSWSKHRNGDVQ